MVDNACTGTPAPTLGWCMWYLQDASCMYKDYMPVFSAAMVHASKQHSCITASLRRCAPLSWHTNTHSALLHATPASKLNSKYVTPENIAWLLLDFSLECSGLGRATSCVYKAVIIASARSVLSSLLTQYRFQFFSQMWWCPCRSACCQPGQEGQG